jgi:predicted CoA-binding protein
MQNNTEQLMQTAVDVIWAQRVAEHAEFASQSHKEILLGACPRILEH